MRCLLTLLVVLLPPIKPRRTAEAKAIGTLPRLSLVHIGRLTWGRGRDGDEIEDVIQEEQIMTSKPRRRSNSKSNAANGNGASGAAGAVKSKFEVNDIDEEAVEDQQ